MEIGKHGIRVVIRGFLTNIYFSEKEDGLSWTVIDYDTKEVLARCAHVLIASTLDEEINTTDTWTPCSEYDEATPQ